VRQGCRQPLRLCAPDRRSATGDGLVVAMRRGLFVLAVILSAAPPVGHVRAAGADAAADGGSDAVSPWATGGASATAKVGDKDGKPGGGTDRLAQVPVSQAYPLPGTVIHGTTIPQGWTPQAVPYRAIGPDGRPVTMHYAPTYVFTYPIGPPVAIAQPPRSPAQVNRRQAYGQPAAYGQGWNYQTQGAVPPTYAPPPPTVARYQPPPYQFPPGAGALAGTPVTPPQAALPPPQMPAAAPPQALGPPPGFGQPLPPPPNQWGPSQPGAPAPPPGIGSPAGAPSASPNPVGQAFAAAAPPAMAAAAASIAPPPSSSQPPTVPVQPVSSLPAGPANSGGAAPTGRSSNSHLWRVVGVHDGDTVTCLDDANQQQKVRLAEIDAPELGQDFGKVARDALAEQVFGKTVEVVDEGKDRYGRWIGNVIIDGKSVNRQMVATGNAWHYAAYSQDTSLAALQQQAQSQKLGLWSRPNPTPPWDYRKNGKKQAGT
jgi:micrococcal nuclease